MFSGQVCTAFKTSYIQVALSTSATGDKKCINIRFRPEYRKKVITLRTTFTELTMNTRIIANDILLGEISRLLAEGKTVTMRTKGNSMLPFITGGKDRVTLVPPEELKIGDIVLAETGPGHYVLHRLIRTENDTVILMGDGNLRGTEQCPKTAVSGKVVRIIRENGKQVDCTTRTELRKWRAWMALRPLRRILLAVYRRLP